MLTGGLANSPQSPRTPSWLQARFLHQFSLSSKLLYVARHKATTGSDCVDNRNRDKQSIDQLTSVLSYKEPAASQLTNATSIERCLGGFSDSQQ